MNMVRKANKPVNIEKKSLKLVSETFSGPLPHPDVLKKKLLYQIASFI